LPEAIPGEAVAPPSAESGDQTAVPGDAAPVSAESALDPSVSTSGDRDQPAPVPNGAAVADETTPPEPEVTEAPDAADADTELGATVLKRLEALYQYVVESAGVEQHQATLIQQLHAETVTLRQGELTQALKPLILDLARLHDDVAGVIERGGEELRKAAVIPELILDVLDRHGVSQIKPAAGEPFDSKLHQGVKGVPTADLALDGTVEGVIRPGFIRDGAHLVRPAQVTVYRYAAPPEAEQATPDADAELESSAAETVAAEATSPTEQLRSDTLG
jgi:molecular chaperone GrpE (heat shock protein)